MSQTTYAQSLTVAREGALADCCFNDIVSMRAAAALKYGLLLQRGTTDGTITPMAALPAADDNSIIATPVATALTAQLLYGATTFDGVHGAAPIQGYAQRLSFTLNNHADWDDTWMKVCYEDPGGKEVVESIFIPNGGNTVLYSVGVASLVKWIFLPAQSGTNGTLIVGTDPTQPYLGIDPRWFFGIACYEHAHESYAAATEVAQYGEVSVLRKGRIWVVTETTCEVGDPAYVRVVLAGADVRGQFAADPAANFVRIPNAYFVSAASADGLAVLQIGG